MSRFYKWVITAFAVVALSLGLVSAPAASAAPVASSVGLVSAYPIPIPTPVKKSWTHVCSLTIKFQNVTVSGSVGNKVRKTGTFGNGVYFYGSGVWLGGGWVSTSVSVYYAGGSTGSAYSTRYGSGKVTRATPCALSNV